MEQFISHDLYLFILQEYIVNDERLCSFIDDDDCRATFVYGYNYTNGVLQVWVQNTKVTFTTF